MLDVVQGQQRPGWLKPYNPDYQWDYENGRFHGTTVSRAYPPLEGSMCSSTFSQNDVITGLTKAGKVQLMKLRELRFTDMGLWAENKRQNYLYHTRDLSITHQISTTGQTGTFQDGETLNASGGGSGTYVSGQSNLTVSPRLLAVRNGSGTFTGTVTGATSGATATISASILIWQRDGVTVSRNQIGNDTVGAANQASSLTATKNNATIFQSVTLASGQFIYSAYVKRLLGTSAIYMTQDGGSNYTDITSSINSSGYARVNVPLATITNPQVGFKIAASGDSIAVDFMQGEGSSYATTPIINKTALNAINTDEPLLNDIDNGNFGYVIIRETCLLQPVTAAIDFSSNNCDNVIVLFQGSGTSLKINITTGGQLNCTNSASSTAQTSNSIDLGYDVVNRAAVRVSGNDIAVCLNGGPVATATGHYLATGSYDHMGVGNSASYDNSANGFIRNKALWKKGLGDTELQVITTR